jgi:hypothetical protein
VANIGLILVPVTVEAGHVYTIVVDGTTGPINVHDGNSLSAPVICRLRDNKRGFFWEAPDSGEHQLLFTGWPNQPGKVTVAVNPAGRTPSVAVA